MAAGGVVVAAEHDAVGPHEVLDRGAFLQEFGIGDHRELQVLEPARGELLADHRCDAVAGTDRHGRLVDHDLEAGHMPADIAGGRQHILQVGRTVLVRRRANGDELHVGMVDRGRDVGGEHQPPGLAVALDQVLQAGLVDRHAAIVEQRDLFFIDVEAEHIVAELGQAGAGDQADITAADDGDFHENDSVRRGGSGWTRTQPSASVRRGA